MFNWLMPVLMCSLCMAAGYWLGFLSGRRIKQGSIQNHRMVPSRIKLEPFGKPSGKRAPRVNDDQRAWLKEQKIGLIDPE